ncbi:hypothetical protein BJX65DRAFT_305920 [Aspergillus insuetus]
MGEDESAVVSRWPARNVATGSENAKGSGQFVEHAPGGRANYVEGLRSRIFELEEALRSNETHKSHGNNPTQLPSPNDTQSSGQISAPLASQDSQPSYCSPGTVAMPQLLLTNCTTRVDLPVIHGTGSGPLELQSGCSSPTSRLPPVDDLAIESHDEISDATGWEVCEMEVDGMGVISSNMQVTASRTRRSSEYFENPWAKAKSNGQQAVGAHHRDNTNTQPKRPLIPLQDINIRVRSIRTPLCAS